MPAPAAPRLIIDQSQTIVVLDTNAARNLAHEVECPPWALTFEEMKKNGYSFSLADGAFMELLNQRARDVIKAHEVERMCRRLSVFLNPDLPIMLGKNDLLGMLQINTRPWSERSCRSESIQNWHRLLESVNAPTPGDSPEAILQDARDEWIDRLLQWQKAVDEVRSQGTTLLETAEGLSPEELLHLLQTGNWATDFTTTTLDSVRDELASWVEKSKRPANLPSELQL
ncbi:TPA: hypothetical protein SMP92_004014 [Pseudomonas putida]|nr:hypothetical protein [Pseudomonas putida]